mgnify:CR=1 FL=1
MYAACLLTLSVPLWMMLHTSSVPCRCDAHRVCITNTNDSNRWSAQCLAVTCSVSEVKFLDLQRIGYKLFIQNWTFLAEQLVALAKQQAALAPEKVRLCSVVLVRMFDTARKRMESQTFRFMSV